MFIPSTIRKRAKYGLIIDIKLDNDIFHSIPVSVSVVTTWTKVDTERNRMRNVRQRALVTIHKRAVEHGE